MPVLSSSLRSIYNVAAILLMQEAMVPLIFPASIAPRWAYWSFDSGIHP